MLERIKIKDVMKTDVLTAPPETTVMDALRLMAARRAGSIIAVRKDRPAGIFTERDLLYEIVLKNRSPKFATIGDVMTRRIVSVETESSLEEAYGKITKGNFRHLLVVERGKLAGILSTKDLIKVRDRVLESQVLEKTAEIAEVRDELARSLDTLNREMHYAGMFQKQLVAKKHPHIEGMRFSHVYEQTSSLGGDYFEVIRVDHDHAGIFMADVMGHGITSAMISIELKMHFDRLAKKNLEPGAVVAEMNNALIPLMPDSYFVVGFYAIAHLDTLEVKYTQFGLPRPVVLHRKTMKTVTLGPCNMPVGFKKGVKYSEGRVRIRPGDCLLLFTDGCTEQKNSRRKVLGERRFIDSFKQMVSAGERRIARKLYGEVLAFAGNETIKDDIAILLCEFLEL